MKATQSSIVRTTEDVYSNLMSKNRLIPKGTKGVIVEVYMHPAEGYAVDVFLPNEDGDNVVLYPHQFEVIEAHDIDIGGLSSSLSPKPDEIQK